MWASICGDSSKLKDVNRQRMCCPSVRRGGTIRPALMLAFVSLAAVGGAPGDLAGQLRPGAVKELAAGKLLVAARNLPDPRFAETVVLLTEFTDQGTMGLIVNQQTEVSVARVVPDLVQAQAKANTVFFGGPVADESVLALLRSDRAYPDSRPIVADVYLIGSRKLLDELIAAGHGSDRLRVYVGYAGWEPGQLSRETAQGAWHVFDGDSSIVFDPDPGSLWSRQIRRTEGLVARR
jgi:putative transcriptional regulator